MLMRFFRLADLRSQVNIRGLDDLEMSQFIIIIGSRSDGDLLLIYFLIQLLI